MRSSPRFPRVRASGAQSRLHATHDRLPLALAAATVTVLLAALAAAALTMLLAAPASAQVIDTTLWVTNGPVRTMARSGNILYIGGSFTSVGPPTGGVVTPATAVARNNLAAIDLSTGAATDWNPGADSTVRALAVHGSTVYVGGYFIHAGGQPRNRFAALDATTGAATAWKPNPTGPYPIEFFAIVANDSMVYVAGEFATIGGQPRQYLAALDATTALATAWNPAPNSLVFALAQDGSTIYPGGEYASIGGQSRNFIAALDAVTGAASGWNPNSDTYTCCGSVSAIVLMGSAVYLGGIFTRIGGLTRNNIVALDAVSGAVKPWNPNANLNVQALLFAGSTLYAGGAFTNIGGQVRNYAAGLDPVSGNATAWNPSLGGYPYPIPFTLAEYGAKVYMGGYFTTIESQPRSYFAAVSDTSLLAGVSDRALEPLGIELAQNEPNPARSSTTLLFTLARAAPVTLAVFDLEGRRMATLIDHAPMAAGEHRVTLRTEGWPPGLYLDRIEAGGHALTRKMLIVR